MNCVNAGVDCVNAVLPTVSRLHSTWGTFEPRHIPKFDALNYLKELHFVPASHIILPEFLQLSDLQGFADHFVVIEAMLSCAQHVKVLRAHASKQTSSFAISDGESEPFDTQGYRNAFVVSLSPAMNCLSRQDLRLLQVVANAVVLLML